jgi:hypothetical protein
MPIGYLVMQSTTPAPVPNILCAQTFAGVSRSDGMRKSVLLLFLSLNVHKQISRTLPSRVLISFQHFIYQNDIQIQTIECQSSELWTISRPICCRDSDSDSAKDLAFAENRTHMANSCYGEEYHVYRSHRSNVTLCLSCSICNMTYAMSPDPVKVRWNKTILKNIISKGSDIDSEKLRGKNFWNQSVNTVHCKVSFNLQNKCFWILYHGMRCDVIWWKLMNLLQNQSAIMEFPVRIVDSDFYLIFWVHSKWDSLRRSIHGRKQKIGDR